MSVLYPRADNMSVLYPGSPAPRLLFFSSPRRWQKWAWTVYATVSLVGIGVPLGFLFERETRAPEHED